MGWNCEIGNCIAWHDDGRRVELFAPWDPKAPGYAQSNAILVDGENRPLNDSAAYFKDAAAKLRDRDAALLRGPDLWIDSTGVRELAAEQPVEPEDSLEQLRKDYEALGVRLAKLEGGK